MPVAELHAALLQCYSAWARQVYHNLMAKQATACISTPTVSFLAQIQASHSSHTNTHFARRTYLLRVCQNRAERFNRQFWNNTPLAGFVLRCPVSPPGGVTASHQAQPAPSTRTKAEAKLTRGTRRALDVGWSPADSGGLVAAMLSGPLSRLHLVPKLQVISETMIFF